MSKESEIEVLSNYRAAHDEIVMLRRRVAELEPQVRVLDIMERMLFGAPKSQVYGEDIAWRLKREVDRLVAAREKDRTDAN